MWLPPDPKSSVPVSTQIVEMVSAAVAAGHLAPGEKLPSVRSLAVTLLVNPNTVAKVYRELEREGVVLARPGSGVSVAEGAIEVCRGAIRDGLERAVDELVRKAQAAGLEEDELTKILISRWGSPIS